MFKPRLRLPRIGLVRPPVRRSIHSVPPLRPELKDGIPRFLSPDAIDIAWTTYMRYLIRKLNQLTAGTEYQDKNIKAILTQTAREPSLAAIFNHASMAHNNTLFFRNLTPKPVEMPDVVKAAIDESFGSVDTLRREFSAVAQGMFGPGFVWLVKTTGGPDGAARRPALRLLATYLAGSPYPQAHWRRQVLDMNTVGGASDAAQGPAREYLAQQQAAAANPGGVTPPPLMGLGSSASGARQLGEEEKRAPGGADVVPLLCLNTWEHVWIRDYGWGEDGHGGKAMFVERWWDAIDWELVAGDINLGGRKGYYTQ